MADHLASLFEDAVFDSLTPKRTAAGAPALSPAGSLNELAAGTKALRFTTAKAKLPGLSITETPKGYLVRANTDKQGLHRVAFDLVRFLQADNNQVRLQFSDELQNFEPDEELIHKSSVPLWVIKPVREGAVMIERVWKA